MIAMHVIRMLGGVLPGRVYHGVICFALSWAMHVARAFGTWNDRNVGVNVLSLQASVRPQAACTTTSAAPFAGCRNPFA